MAQGRKDGDVEDLGHQKGGRRADGDAHGYNWAKFTDDLGANKRADQPDDKTDEYNPPGSRLPVDAVHDVGHQKGERVSERTPGQPLTIKKLNKDIRSHNNGGHGKNAGKMGACHMFTVLCKGAATWPAGIADPVALRCSAPGRKLFRHGELDDLSALDRQEIVI